MNRDWYKKENELLGQIVDTEIGRGEIALWYIGQTGVVLKGDVTVYVDPVLNEIAGPDGVSRKYYPAPFAPGEVRADYILCTHGHIDHLAPETIRGIYAANGESTKYIVPGGCLPIMEELGIPLNLIIPAKAGEKIEVPGMTICPVQAAHPVHAVDDLGRDLALCYDIEMNGVHVLHMGDTYLTDQLYADLQKLPQPDIFLTPINGGDYFRTARDCIGNLSAIESATLAKILRAKLTIPTHFDMMMGNTVDVRDFLGIFWDLNPAGRVSVPALGERVIYRKD